MRLVRTKKYESVDHQQMIWFMDIVNEQKQNWKIPFYINNHKNKNIQRVLVHANAWSWVHNPTSTNIIYTAKWNLNGAVVASQLALHLYVEHWMGRDSIQIQVPFKKGTSRSSLSKSPDQIRTRCIIFSFCLELQIQLLFYVIWSWYEQEFTSFVVQEVRWISWAVP